MKRLLSMTNSVKVTNTFGGEEVNDLLLDNSSHDIISYLRIVPLTEIAPSE